MSKSTLSTMVGNSTYIKVSVTGGTASSYNWTTSNSSVAKLDSSYQGTSDNYIKAVSQGTATITCEVTDSSGNTATATCSVTVGEASSLLNGTVSGDGTVSVTYSLGYSWTFTANKSVRWYLDGTEDEDARGSTTYTFTPEKYQELTGTALASYDVDLRAKNVSDLSDYAKVRLMPFALVYNDNGGSGGPGTVYWIELYNSGSSDYQSHNFHPATESNITPTKSGYTFKGWGSSKSASNPYSSSSVVTVTENSSGGAKKTVYALWDKLQTNVEIGSVDTQYAVAGSSVTFTVSSTPSSGVTYTYKGATPGLSVSISGSTITLSASTPGTYTFTLVANASGYLESTTTVRAEFVPALVFTNGPDAGQLTVW